MDSQVLDDHWREALKDKSRFSLDWYKQHPITRELLKSGVLEDFVIEFGCGIGNRAYIAWMNATGCDITGVDGSPFAIERARMFCGMHSLVFYCADLLALPYRDNDFQNGYMLAVIEHIEDTEKLLSECQRVIEPGGKLFVSVTENDYHGDPSHVHTFDEEKLERVLYGNHFYVLDCYVKDHIVYGTAQVC